MSFQSIIDSGYQAIRSTVFATHGFFSYTRKGYISNSRSFDPNALDVDLTGKVAIVTGANSGLGRATLYALARRGAHVIMVCRNKDSATLVQDDVRLQFPNAHVSLEIVDMSRPREIQAFAENCIETYPHLDILVNNAGVLLNERQETPDGLEATFATNTLGVYQLTTMLLPILKSDDPQKRGRVITVSSGGMYNVALSIDDLQSQKSYDGPLAYSQTKRAEVELTSYWAKTYPDIHFYSMHPGWSHTPGVEKSLPGFFRVMKNSLRTPEQGADSIVWAAISNQVVDLPNGAFLFDRKQVSPHITMGNTMVADTVVKDLVHECDRILEELLSKSESDTPVPGSALKP